MVITQISVLQQYKLVSMSHLVSYKLLIFITPLFWTAGIVDILKTVNMSSTTKSGGEMWQDQRSYPLKEKWSRWEETWQGMVTLVFLPHPSSLRMFINMGIMLLICLKWWFSVKTWAFSEYAGGYSARERIGCKWGSQSWERHLTTVDCGCVPLLWEDWAGSETCN